LKGGGFIGRFLFAALLADYLHAAILMYQSEKAGIDRKKPAVK
jgi:hypothetical protein